MIYKYKCSNKECNLEKEIKQSIKEDSIKICPSCNKETFNRVIEVSNFILKGVGVYKNGTY